MEELLVNMLGERDHWMHAFVLSGNQNWDELRERLEMSLTRAAPDATVCRYTEEGMGDRACLLHAASPGSGLSAHRLCRGRRGRLY